MGTTPRHRGPPSPGTVGGRCQPSPCPVPSPAPSPAPAEPSRAIAASRHRGHFLHVLPGQLSPPVSCCRPQGPPPSPCAPGGLAVPRVPRAGCPNPAVPPRPRQRCRIPAIAGMARAPLCPAAGAESPVGPQSPSGAPPELSYLHTAVTRRLPPAGARSSSAPPPLPARHRSTRFKTWPFPAPGLPHPCRNSRASPPHGSLCLLGSLLAGAHCSQNGGPAGSGWAVPSTEGVRAKGRALPPQGQHCLHPQQLLILLSKPSPLPAGPPSLTAVSGLQVQGWWNPSVTPTLAPEQLGWRGGALPCSPQ